MLFTESIFLFYFLPLALLIHRLSVSRTAGNQYPYAARLVMFLLTILFYGLNATWWLYPFLLGIGFDFLWAYLLNVTQRQGLRKLILGGSVLQNLLLLAVFKYSDQWLDLTETFFPSLARFVSQFYVGETPAGLPPGISFYTFESLSFVIDVYRRVIAPPNNPLTFFAFIGMFPRFVAGPIVRYKFISDQFQNYRGMEIERGLYIFVWGLFLKCCLADSFSTFVPFAFDPVTDLSWGGAWIGAFAYSMQLYFDFSGYSIMAIGLGRCFGFRFPPNFNRPYLASSLRDFWRRWHISLSLWLRDYVYFSLGGNRRGTFRTYQNIFYTMLLGGIWHGSGFTFVVWGVWHGLWLCAERAFFRKWLSPAPLRILTLVIVLVGWVLFRSGDTRQAWGVLRAMFLPASFTLGIPIASFAANPIAIVFCLFGTWYCFAGEKEKEEPEQGARLSLAQQTGAVALFAMAILNAFGRLTVPFVYFQF